ncbi:hypothetical protein ACHAXT_004371 [Thalassiosira profunda]
MKAHQPASQAHRLPPCGAGERCRKYFPSAAAAAVAAAFNTVSNLVAGACLLVFTAFKACVKAVVCVVSVGLIAFALKALPTPALVTIAVVYAAILCLYLVVCIVRTLYKLLSKLWKLLIQAFVPRPLVPIVKLAKYSGDGMASYAPLPEALVPEDFDVLSEEERAYVLADLNRLWPQRYDGVESAERQVRWKKSVVFNDDPDADEYPRYFDSIAEREEKLALAAFDDESVFSELRATISHAIRQMKAFFKRGIDAEALDEDPTFDAADGGWVQDEAEVPPLQVEEVPAEEAEMQAIDAEDEAEARPTAQEAESAKTSKPRRGRARQELNSTLDGSYWATSGSGRRSGRTKSLRL